jgi:hypothetical protein
MIKRLLLMLALTASPVIYTSCQTAPTQRGVEVTTLKALGATVDTTMQIVAQAYKDGRITASQAYAIAEFHDNKFQPAYRLAVAAVQSDLSSIASPDLIGLATQLSQLASQYVK